ncbi:hypothetical protein ALC56_09101, partial [Trachymyrmex septentrionalis]
PALWPLLDSLPTVHLSHGRAPLPRDSGTFNKGPTSPFEKSGAISDARSLPVVQGKRLRELRHRGFAKPVAESYRDATEQIGPHPRRSHPLRET